jgi:mycothiol synthase
MPLRRLRHPEDVISLKKLFERCEESTGHTPLSEHKYRSLVGVPVVGGGLLVEESGIPVGYIHILESKRPGLYELEMAVDPMFAGHIEDKLLDGAISEVSRMGGDSVCLWAYSPIDEVSLHRFGFVEDRSLHQMRVPLPVSAPPVHPGIEIRGFEPGDEEALLALNNRAFLGHPEAGEWTLDDLRLRQEYEWFEKEGIRMAWRAERLAAFCWTKEHPDEVGEIYLIATEPDMRGIGLGRVVALEGLRYLAETKGSRTGMLFADGGNRSALEMYESIGFRIHQTNRAFITSVGPSVA